MPSGKHLTHDIGHAGCTGEEGDEEEEAEQDEGRGAEVKALAANNVVV